jgi:2-oxoacid:acceptor oxidoreductase delta subunit (pyruvate/2-ketoisovalerate family)
MTNGLDVEKWLHDHFDRGGIEEFAFFCIARQGGRTALEILARALIKKGKYAYIGQNLTGLRSMGTNNMVAKFSDAPNIPSSISVTHPKGVMLMHDALVWPDHAERIGGSLIQRSEVLGKFTSGLLMVCTSRAPEEVEYPLDFEGTVATVDAETIFTERVGIQPAPSGITALGLFAAATGDFIDLETLTEAVLDHGRLSKKVREMNVECMKEAYQRSKVTHNLKLKGQLASFEEYQKLFELDLSNDVMTADRKSVSTSWKSSLPVCDMRKCVCIECLSAYACPEAAIKWEDEAIQFDYDFCKGCGTCVTECPENAITMEEVEAVKAE